MTVKVAVLYYSATDTSRPVRCRCRSGTVRRLDALSDTAEAAGSSG